MCRVAGLVVRVILYSLQSLERMQITSRSGEFKHSRLSLQIIPNSAVQVNSKHSRNCPYVRSINLWKRIMVVYLSFWVKVFLWKRSWRMWICIVTKQFYNLVKSWFKSGKACEKKRFKKNFYFFALFLRMFAAFQPDFFVKTNIKRPQKFLTRSAMMIFLV